MTGGRSFTVSVIVVVADPPELVAETEYACSVLRAVGVPVMEQSVEERASPEGNVGFEEHEVITPPVEEGIHVDIGSFTVKTRFGAGY